MVTALVSSASPLQYSAVILLSVAGTCIRFVELCRLVGLMVRARCAPSARSVVLPPLLYKALALYILKFGQCPKTGTHGHSVF